jgi:phenylalanyl-tRNA synthetase beta chain
VKVPLSWLKDFVDLPADPRRVAEDLTLVGLAVDGIETHGGDAVFDVDVTTNRVDCMNVYGVARELAVVYGVPLRPLELQLAESGEPAAGALQVTIDAADLCPRFCARVLDVQIGPSPAWLRERLEKVGVRPIHNVVDLTNYVMMEMGQPTHAFDLDRIPGGALHVRWSRQGEQLTTLDGESRSLAGRIGVVAGSEGPLALAGIMGGASSEVSEGTRRIALEAAYWEPLAIRRAAKALGMHTEASHRFERGADPEGPVAATARIAHLLQKIGAGGVRPGLIDCVAAATPRRRARLRPERLRVLLGVDVPQERSAAILQGLGFEVAAEAGELQVGVPTWRGDVAREADLIEEVGRHFGLGRIPSTLPPSRRAEGLRPEQQRERLLREVLAGFGLSEVIHYAFVSGAAAAADPLPRVRLANPISSDQDVLRSSLVIPGLLGNLKTNLHQGRRDVRLFELGRVFAPAPGRPQERRHLGLLLAGAFAAQHWSEKQRAADVFDMKGLLEGLTQRTGWEPWRFEAAQVPPFLHPGRGAVVFQGQERVGWLGALHPDIAASWELKDETLVAELDVEGLLSAPVDAARFRPLPRFPEVSRDLSVICDAIVPAGDVAARILSAAGSLLRSAAVTDRYEGPQVPPGKVSLTFTLRYQHPERTLTGEEVQASVERIVAALKGGGAEIRGE